MRWAVVAVLFVAGVFGFFVGYSVCTLVLTEFSDALTPTASVEAIATMTLLQVAFGVICAIALVMMVIIFGIESLTDDVEYDRYRRP